MAEGARKNRKREKAGTKARTSEPAHPAQASSVTRLKAAVLLGGSLLVLVAGVLLWPRVSNVPAKPQQTAELTFVGSEACSGCHATETKLWRTSQHRHAMDHATDQSVRGDFNDAVFEYAGMRSRFSRRDRKFLVETDGPDGKPATFEIKYTFGLDPLQQYLIEFPDGSIQALSIAWDTRPKDQGGQRWFHRRLGEIAREMKRIVDCIVITGMPPEQFVARLQELEAEKAKVIAGLESAKESDNVIALHPKALDRYKRAVVELAVEMKRGTPSEFATIRELVTAIVVHASPSRPGGAGTKANVEDDRRVRIDIKGRLAALCGNPCFRTWLCRGERW
ncbi:hypothetical protein GA0061098_1011101 [Bradyrhizobium shewense]|uniref:Cytochrome c domain-containing protein n=1 Tax=Bradyrhizobium shewense TaxID=1761772 RepID=A0A1C3X0F7_9BRAD|nr:hypothetical protein GA0061098_1011101 [Bradyrhizobium shewense]